mmetsp:Transcript_18011/g.44823  ORF Transcript_18011/g.44823 Transcript_18011/m.44823 type:complete len:106 (+) Transcript_18011:429-746(+)
MELLGKLARSGMSQIPQLTSSRPLELEETPFSLRSRATGGTQRALLVGVNYCGQSGQLSGCINDVLNLRKCILDHHGFLRIVCYKARRRIFVYLFLLDYKDQTFI